MAKPSAVRLPQIVFGNTVNELMLSVPVPAHATSLHVVSPRKLWLAEAGDMVVTPCPIGRAFAAYALQTLELSVGDVELVTTSSSQTSFLASDVLSSKVFDTLQRYCLQRPDAELLCYALDASTAALAARLGIRPSGYLSPPDEALVRAIHDLNTKSGFRAAAQKLDLPIPPGEVCAGANDLRAAVATLLRGYDRAIIKLDRSSNAFASTVISGVDGDVAIAAGIEKQLGMCQGQPEKFVVETCFKVAASPSIELIVTEEGVQTYYLCLQNYRNGRFSGMIADETQLAPEIVSRMTDAGLRFGRHLFSLGYRGVFDLDAIITDERGLLFTEVNVRRTAGTFVHELLLRLLGPDYPSRRVWLTDSAPGRATSRFEIGCAVVRSAGLDFDRRRGKGVLLTSDAVLRDGQWRYLVVAEDAAEAALFERGLAAALALAR